MKSTLLFLFIALAVAVNAQQPTGQLNLKLNKNILQPDDSLLVQVDYKQKSSEAVNQSLATLELIIENEAGQRTRLRWPVIDGQASGAIFLPDSLPRGKYTLIAGLQQRFFEVVGQVREAKKISTINAMLLTKSGDWLEQEIDLSANGSFSIRNWLFEDNALLAFYDPKGGKQPLNIAISTQLDSSFQPLAVAGRIFYVGNPPATERATLDKPVESPEALFADRGTLLPAVIVRSTAKTPAQQFDEQYVSGLFRSGDERMLSIMDDPSALGYPNILSYLQGRVAGLQIAPNGLARWRGSRVNFFLDEMRVSAQQIATIPVTDIAIVKAFPPPFFGAPGGGGGVAIYTRRGGEINNLPLNRQVFRIRGYTPSAISLNMNTLRM